ncbi:MAG: arginine--tRNA ligase [Candidatus Bathyarchaeota archaeon]|nr:MAG: arginine--tRNA ligase [Candidatus Bathyarchaeota archaeon]
MAVPSINPFGDFRAQCKNLLLESIDATLSSETHLQYLLEHEQSMRSLQIPPSSQFGDLASSICFLLAGKLNVSPQKLAEVVVQNLDCSNADLVEKARAINGYINFLADDPHLSRLTLESAITLGRSYGSVKVTSPLKIIVEHTSVNPAGPIHVGTARNSILGASLARLLQVRGHEVTTHFYVDDVGRQIAVLAYGYRMLKNRTPTSKADRWIGLVYAITSCILEIERLKRELKTLDVNYATRESANKLRLTLDDWVSAAADLQDRDENLFVAILNGIQSDVNSEEHIANIMRFYEKKDIEITRLIREVVDLCLNGYRETYRRVGIDWDSWDWESDLVWRGAVSDVVTQLAASTYAMSSAGALTLNVNAAAEQLGLKQLFGLSHEHEIPSLVLTRSDGTTLYSTRDIAYSLWKLDRADQVINVIGIEQTLAQLQIRIALGVLRSHSTAERMVHYAYDLVKLPGYKMSKRQGRYITFDEILDESIKRALNKVNRRSPSLSSKLKTQIANAVGVGAVKHALLNVAPSKPVAFTWEKVLNFDINSAPFLQYAYARACNILEKAEKDKGIQPDYSLLTKPVELALVRKIALFPENVVSAADNLTPSLIPEFVYTLASIFNSFYASAPVLVAKPIALRDARLALVNSVKISLKNSLDIMGIQTLERM